MKICSHQQQMKRQQIAYARNNVYAQCGCLLARLSFSWKRSMQRCIMIRITKMCSTTSIVFFLYIFFYFLLHHNRCNKFSSLFQLNNRFHDFFQFTAVFFVFLFVAHLQMLRMVGSIYVYRHSMHARYTELYAQRCSNLFCDCNNVKLLAKILSFAPLLSHFSHKN